MYFCLQIAVIISLGGIAGADSGGPGLREIDPIVTGSKVTEEQLAAWHLRREQYLKSGLQYQPLPDLE
jgi:hypothetical protein